jgi:hypothetical protein
MLVELIDYYKSKIGINRILILLSSRTITKSLVGDVSSTILDFTIL